MIDSLLAVDLQVMSGTMWYWVWFDQSQHMKLRELLRLAGASVTWVSSLTNIKWMLHWHVQGLDWSLLVSIQQVATTFKI